jgi:hypothetical protein
MKILRSLPNRRWLLQSGDGHECAGDLHLDAVPYRTAGVMDSGVTVISIWMPACGSKPALAAEAIEEVLA